MDVERGVLVGWLVQTAFLGGCLCFWFFCLFVLILKAEIEHNNRRNDLFETFREDLVKNFLRLNKGEK